MHARLGFWSALIGVLISVNSVSAQFGNLPGGAGYMVGQPPQVNQAMNLARTQNNFNDPALNYFLGTQPINSLARNQIGLGNAFMDIAGGGDIRPGFMTGDPEIDQLNGRIRPIRRPAGFGYYQNSFGTVRVMNRPPFGFTNPNASYGGNNNFFQPSVGVTAPQPR